MKSLRIWVSTVLVAIGASLPRLALATYPIAAAPSLQVPGCPQFGVAHFNKTVPDQQDFPYTEVALCYNWNNITMAFSAWNETSFYFDPAQGTNDDIWKYEVMETFVALGDADPQTYLEFEVSPNNVTFNAFIYNPTKVRAENATFERFYINNTLETGFNAFTTLDKKQKLWSSTISIPLGLFNIDNGAAKGTKWRMNFFRTVVDSATFPNQTLGGWSSPDKASFHITPFFGHVEFT
ncbi:uncharacterized protein PG998_005552 [Apiospora kogelbergensis]|uniref:Carbohydrate-binding domain-containing protein n=1 Tax=Apiospora kogelbergensis TaxID=1337665 RepID=A0AAW0Q979_9PEZI